MNSPWINQLGNWNPQLLREFRGRLKPRSLIAAIAISLIIQALTLLLFFEANSRPTVSDWEDLWSLGFSTIPYILIGLGGYYLVNNLNQEEKVGTLNFIRLSPRPAWQILLGKLIGVPILPAIAVGLFIPLHLCVSILARIPLLLTLSYYLMLGVGCLLFWSLGMLFGLVGSNSPGVVGQATTLSVIYAAASLIVLAPVWSVWNSLITWAPIQETPPVLDRFPIEWCWVVINQNLLFSHGFTLLTAGIALFILWRVMLRRFRRPRATLLSRRQSYGILFFLLIFTVGFFLNSELWDSSPNNAPSYFDNFDILRRSAPGVIMILTFPLTLVLMVAICPHRQALLEWSRQPRQDMMGLIWADKSPAHVSFSILLVIVNLVLVPLALLFPTNFPTEVNASLSYLVSIVGLTSTLFLIGTFMQFVFTLKLRNPAIWLMGSLLLWWIVPPIILGIISSSADSISVTAIFWAFFGYPAAHWGDLANLPLVLVGIFGQWGATGFLIFQIQLALYNFRQAGPVSLSESDTEIQ